MKALDFNEKLVAPFIMRLAATMDGKCCAIANVVVAAVVGRLL